MHKLVAKDEGYKLRYYWNDLRGGGESEGEGGGVFRS